MDLEIDPKIKEEYEQKSIPELARMMNVKYSAPLVQWFNSNDTDIEALRQSGTVSEQKAIYLYNLHNVFKFLNDRTILQLLSYITDALKDCITSADGNFNHEDKTADTLVKCLDVINHHLYVAINVRDLGLPTNKS